MEKDLHKDSENNFLVPHTGEICELVKEDNYIFRATNDLKNKVGTWIESNAAVEPDHVMRKMLQELKD